MSAFVYLASQSPRRSQLLNQLGIAHELLLPDPDEDAEALEAALPNEAPRRYVKRVTLLKLQAALQRLQARGLPPAPVLCADTTVAMGHTMLGKPVNDADAQRMLQALSGRVHRVLTAVAVGTASEQRYRVSESTVRFATLTGQDIQQYVASGEPAGKAGAYAVQGRAAAHIEHVTGSYTGIMGLPLFETAQLLAAFG